MVIEIETIQKTIAILPPPLSQILKPARPLRSIRRERLGAIFLPTHEQLTIIKSIWQKDIGRRTTHKKSGQ